MYIINELKSNADKIGLNYSIIKGVEAEKLISKIFKKFDPLRTSGHLAISDNSKVISLEENEFTYTLAIKKQKGYLFFDQEGVDRNLVLEVENVQRVGELMEESFGIEYFLSNSDLSFLIAVNWYVIEVSGDCEDIEDLMNI
ncbi:hypothetical protein [Psychrobacter piscatorii]|uniref:hypothetical protein n=1 Tax=Psychrobacter piscatorii TaxID=554343 RepID=UPI003736DF44